MPKKAYTEEEINTLKIRIMDGASSIMAEKGVANISMRQLASALGMTAPNLYNYFPSKYDLFLATSLRGFELLEKNMQGAVSTSDTPREQLRAIFKSSFKFAKEWSGYWELIFHPPLSLREFEGTDFVEADRMIREKTFALMMDAVQEATKYYSESPEFNVPVKAVMAMTFVHGLIDLYNHRLFEMFGSKAEQNVGYLIDQSLDVLFPAKS